MPYFWKPHGWGMQSIGHNIYLCVGVFMCKTPYWNAYFYLFFLNIDWNSPTKKFRTVTIFDYKNPENTGKWKCRLSSLGTSQGPKFILKTVLL